MEGQGRGRDGRRRHHLRHDAVRRAGGGPRRPWIPPPGLHLGQLRVLGPVLPGVLAGHGSQHPGPDPRRRHRWEPGPVPPRRPARPGHVLRVHLARRGPEALQGRQHDPGHAGVGRGVVLHRLECSGRQHQGCPAHLQVGDVPDPGAAGLPGARVPDQPHQQRRRRPVHGRHRRYVAGLQPPRPVQACVRLLGLLPGLQPGHVHRHRRRADRPGLRADRDVGPPGHPDPGSRPQRSVHEPGQAAGSAHVHHLGERLPVALVHPGGAARRAG